MLTPERINGLWIKAVISADNERLVFARLIERAALEEAVQRCEAERVENVSTEDEAYNTAIDDCIEAIRKGVMNG